MRFIKQLFTWWSGQTLGTRLFTIFRGKKVGEDAQGNAYYESSTGRRWVIFHDYSEASQVPAEWHGWLHHSFDNRPGHKELATYEWMKPHQENQTGTPNAYAPKGSQFGDGVIKADYQAWKPE